MAEARVMAVLARHEASLMRVARQWSLCHDDALDAFQRGLEIYLRRLDSVDRATEAAWLRVVIRHEALAIRRARTDNIADTDVDLDTAVPAAERSVEEQILSSDRVGRSAEALRALKPDEARALMLKAHGLSYEEIGRRCGWTYTKVNRAITEGRRRFLEVYRALEAGEDCDRFAPILEALAAGTASSQDLVEVRPHLRRCSACRATVRDLHLSGLRRLRLLLPFPLVEWLRQHLGGGRGDSTAEQALHLTPLKHARVPDGGVPGLPHGGGPLEVPDLHVPQGSDPLEIPDLHVPQGGDPLEIPDLHVPQGGDLPDLQLPHAADAPQLPDLAPSRPLGHEDTVDFLDRFKQQATSLLHRTNASDLAATIHIATTTGTGRVATLGALVGICLSGVGAGTVCVVTGVLDDPFGLIRLDPPPAHVHHTVHHEPKYLAPSQPTPAPQEHLAGRPIPTPTPTPTPTPAPHTRRPASTTPQRPVITPAPTATATYVPPASADPAQGTTPTSQENAPVSPAPQQSAVQEFSAAPSSGTDTAPTAAAAPATGGEEFAP